VATISAPRTPAEARFGQKRPSSSDLALAAVGINGEAPLIDLLDHLLADFGDCGSMLHLQSKEESVAATEKSVDCVLY
jgi:hypothetical protein